MSIIKVKIKNVIREYPKGIQIQEIAKQYQESYKYKIVLAIVNNELRELFENISDDCEIDFVDLSCEDGLRTYMRSLSFVFIKACDEVLNVKCRIEHSLAKGIYCELKSKEDITEDDVKKIKIKMEEIIESDQKFEKVQISLKEAVEIFEQEKRYEKVNILKYKNIDTTKIYKLGNMKDYFYGYLVPSTGYLKLFDVKKYSPGIIILGPSREMPDKIATFVSQPKLAQIYKEAESWAKVMNINTVASLNECIKENKQTELIRTVEAFHEKKISQIADMIVDSCEKVRVILISGPSSSGKTSFAQRLLIQLRVNKLRPVAISLDDYFVDRENTPKNNEGDYDFESIHAIDLELFNEHLQKLILGEEVEMPKFNFKTGKREYRGEKLKIDSDQPLVIEGIHGLNELLTKSIPSENKFKIYVSALTQLNLDEHNRIPTTDLRLIRRIVRDNTHRGHDPKKTIQMWPLVRAGEEKNIFPYQEEATVMFNSACIYELAVLKKYIVPLLESIDDKNKEHIESKRLLKFLQYFYSIDEEIEIPRNSILREFIGGSGIVH